MTAQTQEYSIEDVKLEAGKEQHKTDLSERMQLIIFKLGSEEYGLSIDQIKEVVLTPRIAKMPQTSSYIKGVANIRGNIIAIMDLEQKFGLSRNETEENTGNGNHSRRLLVDPRFGIHQHLQMLISLSSIHRNNQLPEETEAILIEAENRARTISVINDTLDWNKDISDVRVDVYTKELVRLLSQTYGHTRVEINLEIENASLSVTSALNYGIILNELLANCYKHAFRNDGKGEIEIKLVKKEDVFFLSVSDNGPGVTTTPEQLSGSEGLMIIRGIVSQMNGGLTIEKTSGGLHVRVSFTDM